MEYIGIRNRNEFGLLGTEPICGVPWYRQHLGQYTPEYMSQLGLVIVANGNTPLPTRYPTDKRGMIREVITHFRERG